jgi:hypothetical protein
MNASDASKPRRSPPSSDPSAGGPHTLYSAHCRGRQRPYCVLTTRGYIMLGSVCRRGTNRRSTAFDDAGHRDQGEHTSQYTRSLHSLSASCTTPAHYPCAVPLRLTSQGNASRRGATPFIGDERLDATACDTAHSLALH